MTIPNPSAPDTEARGETRDAELETYLAERNKALEGMDLTYGQSMLPKGTRLEVVELAMHKARYECLSISNAARHTSAAWLRERGYGRFDGSALLPEGELPT